MEKIDNIRIELKENSEALFKKACKRAKLEESKVKYFKVLKKSIDARDKSDLHYVYSVELGYLPPEEITVITPKYNYPDKRVAIIGSGAAGLFSALVLARNGFKPIVIERGDSVDTRKAKIDKFISSKTLDTETNIQFGEGGAGTYSDGKLNTGVKSEYKNFILDEFISHGAPKEIAYENKPHIGSDKLPSVIKNIREEIISLGGEFMFNTKFTDISVKDGAIDKIFLDNGKPLTLEVSLVILAVGHSARDTFIKLYDRGVVMEQKDMAVGLRIEHLQENINISQYGKKFAGSKLDAADYKLTSSVGARGVFTFCMCPGGFVVPASSEEGGLVTNGISNYARDGVNANSALVVQVKKEDYGEGVTAGIDYLRNLEKLAFSAGGGNYSAPCQLVGDFLKGKDSRKFGAVTPTYPIGVNFSRLDKLLPDYIVSPLKSGIVDMDKRLKGFACPDAVLTGVETRTSSPLRILRNEKGESVNIKNLYPVGEVGYAGGIMSSAIDGVNAAKKIMRNYA